MIEYGRCTKCGQLIPMGEVECPYCTVEGRAGTSSPEAILGFSLVLLVILFIVAGFAARTYHAKERALGQEWFSQGTTELKNGKPDAAIVDFRTALIYDRNNDAFEFNLAKALLAAKHTDEARAHLARLWDRQPESGEVNLELGRLAAQGGDVTQALRYYHNSIYGDWQQEDAAGQRRNARMELYQFLTRQRANRQAQAELMALAAELPPDPELHNQVGRLFLEAGEYGQAEKQYLQSLQFKPYDAIALAGAGEAEFQLADYRNAMIHLERAVRHDPRNLQVAKTLETARQVLSMDPFEPSLSTTERNSRIARAFRQAEDRLQACAESKGEDLVASPPQTPMQNLYQQALKVKSQFQEGVLAREPGTAAAAISWVGDAENLAASTCGPPAGLDEAIVLAWRGHGGGQK